MADWSLPTIGTNYTEVLAKLDQKDADAATMFSVGSSSNVPDGTIRWNVGLAKFQKLNSGTYEDLASTYNINVQYLRGRYPATTSVINTIPLRDSNGDITTRLFRSQYDTQTAAPLSTAAICFRSNNAADNYLRFVSREGFISYLGRVNDSDNLAGISHHRYKYVNTIYSPSSGVLITTNVQYGQMIRIEINGNGYASGDVLNTVIEFYVYKNATTGDITIEYAQALQSGKPFDVHIFMQGGVAKVWVPHIGYAVSYNISCIDPRTIQNLPITLTDESDPTDGITAERRVTPKLILTDGMHINAKTLDGHDVSYFAKATDTSFTTMSDETANRVTGTTYTNNTGKAMLLVLNMHYYGDAYYRLFIDDIEVGTYRGNGNDQDATFTAVVLNGSTYKLTGNDGNNITRWMEYL